MERNNQCLPLFLGRYLGCHLALNQSIKVILLMTQGVKCEGEEQESQIFILYLYVAFSTLESYAIRLNRGFLDRNPERRWFPCLNKFRVRNESMLFTRRILFSGLRPVTLQGFNLPDKVVMYHRMSIVSFATIILYEFFGGLSNRAISCFKHFSLKADTALSPTRCYIY